MKSRTLHHGLALLACAGMLVPSSAFADEKKQSDKTKAAPRVVDVALTSGGTLDGQLVDASGKPVDGAELKLFLLDKQVAKTSTNKAGRYRVAGLKGGLYRVVAPGGERLLRLWAEGTAPPKAMTAAVLVNEPMTVRGQYGYVEPTDIVVVGLGITAVTLSAITLAEVNDLQDDNDELRQELIDLISD